MPIWRWMIVVARVVKKINTLTFLIERDPRKDIVLTQFLADRSPCYVVQSLRQIIFQHLAAEVIQGDGAPAFRESLHHKSVPFLRGQQLTQGHFWRVLD